MLYRLSFILLSLLVVISCGSVSSNNKANAVNKENSSMNYEIKKTDAEWKSLLNKDEYYILREKGTEAAFSGEYDKFYKEGTYLCKACDNRVFSSKTKFDSGTGWPSFYEPINKDSAVRELKDYSFGMVRTEIVCNRCGSHLGHLFSDGPKPTGLRYCINSKSLKFVPKTENNVE